MITKEKFLELGFKEWGYKHPTDPHTYFYKSRKRSLDDTETLTDTIYFGITCEYNPHAHFRISSIKHGDDRILPSAYQEMDADSSRCWDHFPNVTNLKQLRKLLKYMGLEYYINKNITQYEDNQG